MREMKWFSSKFLSYEFYLKDGKIPTIAALYSNGLHKEEYPLGEEFKVRHITRDIMPMLKEKIRLKVDGEEEYDKAAQA